MHCEIPLRIPHATEIRAQFLCADTYTTIVTYSQKKGKCFLQISEIICKVFALPQILAAGHRIFAGKCGILSAIFIRKLGIVCIAPIVRSCCWSQQWQSLPSSFCSPRQRGLHGSAAASWNRKRHTAHPWMQATCSANATAGLHCSADKAPSPTGFCRCRSISCRRRTSAPSAAAAFRFPPRRNCANCWRIGIRKGNTAQRQTAAHSCGSLFRRREKSDWKSFHEGNCKLKN